METRKVYSAVEHQIAEKLGIIYQRDCLVGIASYSGDIAEIAINMSAGGTDLEN